MSLPTPVPRRDPSPPVGLAQPKQQTGSAGAAGFALLLCMTWAAAGKQRPTARLRSQQTIQSTTCVWQKLLAIRETFSFPSQYPANARPRLQPKAQLFGFAPEASYA